MPEQSHPSTAVFDEQPPIGRARMAWMHIQGPWSVRRAWNLVLALLAHTPGMRRYVLSTTPLKAHPMFAAHERSWRRAVTEAAVEAHEVHDHPAGCFYGTFGGYPDNWHIPYGADCDLDHGPEPIRLGAPGGSPDA